MVRDKELPRQAATKRICDLQTSSGLKFPFKKKFSGTVHKNKDWIDIMMTLNSYLSIVTLNMKGLNDPIERRRVSDWIKKQGPSICCLQETHFRHKDTYSLKIKSWRTIYHLNCPPKKAGVAILISGKLKFIPKTVVRDEEGWSMNRSYLKDLSNKRTQQSWIFMPLGQPG